MAEKQIWSSVGEFVTEGFMLAVPLCFPGQSAPPPSGEVAIRSLALDPGGTVYCGTAGRKAHVMAALLRGDTGAVFDMGTAPGAESIDGLLVHDEHVYAVASGPAGSALWRWPRLVRNFLIQEWSIARHQPEKVADITAAARVADAVVAKRGPAAMYALTDPGGELLRIDVAAGTVEPAAKVNEEGRFGRRIATDRQGRIWGSRGAGILWRYDPFAKHLEDVAAIPAAAGRAQHTQVSAWAADEAAGQLYGGTTPDGFLFRLSPKTGRVVGLGKPTRLEDVTCLAVGHDGRLFGAAGLEEDIGHVFCYEPRAGAIRDLGIPVAALAARQYGYHFRSMMAGPGGEIYLGQYERIAHLWIYFPPAPPTREWEEEDDEDDEDGIPF